MKNFLTRMFGPAPANTEWDAVVSQVKAAPASSGGGTKLLPPIEDVKAPKGGGAAYPSYRKSITANTSRIQQKPFEVTNVDIVSAYRGGASTVENVRSLSRASPEMSAAFAANARVGIPEKYICIARNPDGSINVPGTQLAMQILRQMNAMPDYQDGFSHVGSLRSVCESLARTMQTEGAMAMELVLDKTRLPLGFQPVGPSQIFFYEDDKGLKPIQKVGGEEIDLDIPTFFYVTLDPDVYDAYSQSPMESALQPTLSAAQFLNDMRRLCQRHVYQRYDISLDEEKIKERLPAEVIQDPTLLPDYLDSLIQEVSDVINNVGLEEALIHYDYFTVEYIKNDGDTPGTFETVNTITSGKLATALRTPPSVLGMGSTSQNLASTETLMFMLNANGMIRLKLHEILSKAMTLSVRLFGLDVACEFEFDDIEMRPAGELEAYKLMKQSRLLTQLSFGFISDEEYCLRTSGQLPPPGHTPLSGTMFPVVPAAIPADNGNNTSTTGAKPADNAAPAAAKGSTKGKK